MADKLAETQVSTRIVSLDSLRRDTRNVRRRTDRSAKMIRDSLERFGAGRSLLVDEAGQLIVGNGTAEQAAALGMNRVVEVTIPRDTLVAVRRTDLDPTEKTGLALADNRSSDLSEIDALALASWMEEEPGLDVSTWFDDSEIQALAAALNVEEEEVEEEEDEGAVPPAASPGEAKNASANLEFRLKFETQQEFDRFADLLAQLASRLPDEDQGARLIVAVMAYLAE